MTRRSINNGLPRRVAPRKDEKGAATLYPVARPWDLGGEMGSTPVTPWLDHGG